MIKKEDRDVSTAILLVFLRRLKCQKALKDLKQDETIEILPADKGRINVVLDDDT